MTYFAQHNILDSSMLLYIGIIIITDHCMSTPFIYPFY